ncbi:MAG: hypothetical protein Q8P90_02520 [bacterium]|nr:hypothetical protein [bacterium]
MFGPAVIEADTVAFNETASLGARVKVIGPNEPQVTEAMSANDSVTYEYKKYDGEGKYNNVASKNNDAGIELFFIPLSFHFAWKVYLFFAYVLVGLILVAIFPKYTLAVAETMKDKPGATLLCGMATMFIMPLVILGSFVTIIGIPLAAILTAIYMVALCIAKIFVGIVFGLLVLKSKNKKDRKLYGPFLLGYFLLFILLVIPFFGMIVKLLAMMWGIGGMGYHLWQIQKKS